MKRCVKILVLLLYTAARSNGFSTSWSRSTGCDGFSTSWSRGLYLGPSHPSIFEASKRTELLSSNKSRASCFNSVSSSSEKQTPLSSSAIIDCALSYTSVKRDLSSKLVKIWKNLCCNSIWHWRLVFGSFFSSLFLFREYLDSHVLKKLWNYLLTSQALPARIFRTDSWEWCFAISCFAVYIHAFGWADRLVRAADKKGRIHPWKKFRLQDRYMADQRRRQLLSNNQGSHSARTEVEINDVNIDPIAPQHSKWNWSAWSCEFWVYALPLLIWDIVSPRRHRRIGAFGPPTTAGILGGIVGGLMLYDILFFCGHWLMHKVPWLYRNVHAKHHITKEVRACEIVRLSLSEEVLEVGFSIIALNLLGVHPVARSLYNMIITFLLTELHCGFDFPWQPQNVVPFGLATGSRRHHYHHRQGKFYYQKFFFHADRLFGFFQRNDGSLEGDSVQPDAYIPKSWQTPALAS